MMWQDVPGSGVIQMAANCLERHTSLSQAASSGKNVNRDQLRPRGRDVNCARFINWSMLLAVAFVCCTACLLFRVRTGCLKVATVGVGPSSKS
jgi:ABC-type uncharacterized transport system permease subunit